MDKLEGRGWAMGWLKNEGKGGGPPGAVMRAALCTV